MKIDGKPYRTIWHNPDSQVFVLDQTRLPFFVEEVELKSLEAAALAIENMVIRGAPLIGVTAAYGIFLAMKSDASDASIETAYHRLVRTRPTAVNLGWALGLMRSELQLIPPSERANVALRLAAQIAEDDVASCEAIGELGLKSIRRIAEKKQAPVNVLTHCNAGWLACVDWGTALSPVYKAQAAGIPIHVWVDETRPRNQGAFLTAFELGAQGIPHTVIADNTGGHLMQNGMVDLCIVGADRVAKNGDVANKIGTYLKALAAFDNQVPFYVACPQSTLDLSCPSGASIPIEERDAREVTHLCGLGKEGTAMEIRVVSPNSPAMNYGFDVTPFRLVTEIWTNAGVFSPLA